MTVPFVARLAGLVKQKTRVTMVDPCDMIVLGGGPAGAVSAWLAARDGLRVRLIDPCRESGRLEGLSPRLHQWLRQSGLGTGGSTLGPVPRRVDWGGEISHANGEYILDRDRLDAHLRGAAQAAGAELVQGTGHLQDGRVTLAEGGEWTARWLIDARGRRSHRAARHVAEFSSLSICGWYRTEPARAAGCAVNTLPEGWIWRADLADGRGWAQFTCDARSSLGLKERLLAALQQVLPGAEVTLLAPPMARQATPVLPAEIADLTCLPVGDALAAMDPLSGHGMFWAVSSALAAAAARRTLTARPGATSEALCRRYLQERAAATYLRNARIGRDFIRLEARHAAQPFWAARGAFPDEVPAHEVVTGPEIRRGLGVRGGLVEEMEMLHTPDHPEGVGWFGSVPAADLWRRIAEGASREALLAEHGPGIGLIYDGLCAHCAEAAA